MNPWWIILMVLAGTWAAPVMAIRRAGFPVWFFVCLGCFWMVVCLAAEPLYDWGVDFRRKLGMARLADFGERMKPRLLPPARLALCIMAAISFAAALL